MSGLGTYTYQDGPIRSRRGEWKDDVAVHGQGEVIQPRGVGMLSAVKSLFT